MPNTSAFSSLKIVRQPKNVLQEIDLPKTISSCSLSSRDHMNESLMKEELIAAQSSDESESEEEDECFTSQMKTLLIEYQG